MAHVIRKPGGFPPKSPGKPQYDLDGFYTDEYACKLASYKAKYERWEKHLKPWEEVFGVPFVFIDEPCPEYMRKKKYGLLEPLKIEYDGQHPADKLF